jgi:outer membrane immunogenic protein
VREHWIATLRGRLGYKFGAQDQFMLYVTGGGAAARVELETCLPGVFCTSTSNTMNGWTVGAGGEWAIFPSTPVPHGWLSFKVEYLYVDLGRGGAIAGSDAKFQTNIVRAGLNYRF